MSLNGKHYMIEGSTQDYAISFHFLNPKLGFTSSKKVLSKELLNIA